MTTSSDKGSLLRKILENLEFKPHKNGTTTFTQDDVDKLPFVKAKLGPTGIFGIRKEAGEALSNLASSIFTSSQLYRRGTTYKEILDSLSDCIILNFFSPRENGATMADIDFVESKISTWFESEAGTYEFYVPCAISPWPSKPFKIGPVTFTHLSNFEIRAREASKGMFEITFQSLFEAMQAARAHWIATVEVAKCTDSRANEIGDLAVDIAIVAIQLAIPPYDTQHMARMTARTIPSFKQTVFKKNRHFSAGSANQTPGMSIGPDTLEILLERGKELLDAIGPRIKTFLGATALLPALEQAWIDAAYWFHEGLAEPLDTIAVTKLETAIEVLLRSESTSGSKSRLLRAIRVFYGLAPNQFINPTSEITVEQFAKGFVTDRSRIIHGTWSTLTHSLRDSRPSLTILVRGLLIHYALELNRYLLRTDAKDDLGLFLGFVESRRASEKKTGA